MRPAFGFCPGAYLPLSRPPPTGLYVITPSPSSRASGRISDSAWRFTSEYMGWITSKRGQPMRALTPRLFATCHAA